MHRHHGETIMNQGDRAIDVDWELFGFLGGFSAGYLADLLRDIGLVPSYPGTTNCEAHNLWILEWKEQQICKGLLVTLYFPGHLCVLWGKWILSVSLINEESEL